MENLNFKNLLHNRNYGELKEEKEEYENQFSKKRRKNDDLEVKNNFIVKSILSSAAVFKHTINSKKTLPRQK